MKAIDLEDEEEEVQGFLFHFLTCCTKQRHECFVVYCCITMACSTQV